MPGTGFAKEEYSNEGIFLKDDIHNQKRIAPMGETLGLIIAFPAGLALGAFYFLSLWKTLQKIPDVPNPGLVMFRNYAFRISVVLIGFYLIMDGHWERIAVALFGFVIMREILTRRFGKDRTIT
jgi:F1F0 ATPase subunit 2